MKIVSIVFVGLGIATAALPAVATAAPYPQARYHQGQQQNAWQSIDRRQANLYNRIDQGIRSGALNRNEAFRLKTQFRNLVSLEQSYRRGGLNTWERTDLNRKFDALSIRITTQRTDRQGRRF